VSNTLQGAAKVAAVRVPSGYVVSFTEYVSLVLISVTAAAAAPLVVPERCDLEGKTSQQQEQRCSAEEWHQHGRCSLRRLRPYKLRWPLAMQC